LAAPSFVEADQPGYHQAWSSLDSMARRFSRAHLSHTQTDPRRASDSSIQVSGGSATVVPHIEQLAPVESAAVISAR
jgi:hypothetical protein